ncbi:unnamed protein product [Mytilus edulis]|uniref:Integrase zinc-binding domain-containing protein n=1 Tax=Mytilus edulis TaxID=6550 RepID=A0A8S3UQ54_MYTED|nr:unnamed protein product [Mytilus edulis]
MSNIDDQIAEISRQIQSLSESTIQHGQGFISSQGVRPKVFENKEHDSGVVTTGSSLSTPVGLAVGDTLPLPDRDIMTNPQIDYFAHFEMCTIVNMWSEHKKGLYLAVSLIEQAQSVLGDLPKEKRQIFSDLVSALEERFAPSSQTELYRVQFKESRQKVNDTLPGLGQSVRRLSNLAYPTAPLELRDTLAKEQFIDALVDSEMRLRIKQSRPKGLNDAIRLAVDLEAYNTAESKKLNSMGHLGQTSSDERTETPDGPDTAVSMEQMTTWIQTIENDLLAITKEIKDLKFQRKFQPRGKINSTQSAVVSASADAGMFVELNIQDVPAKFVVDTGATLTPHLNEIRSEIKSVSDKYLNPRGKGNFILDFGQEKLTSEAVVADLQVDGILGLDFLKKNKCLIDVSTSILHIDNLKFPLLFQGIQIRNRKLCRFISDRRSKTDRECSKREQNQVNIVTIQSNDSDLKRVKRWLAEGQRPHYNEVSNKGYSLRSLWSQFGCLEVHGDVVVRRHMDRELNVVKLQAVIPMSERKQVLQCCHETKCAGHLGIHKTIEKIRQSFYWPGLQSDVRTYVAGSNKCTRNKRPMKRKCASARLEKGNGLHESKRPACMADYVNK